MEINFKENIADIYQISTKYLGTSLNIHFFGQLM